jgi:CubicO group peptidase (beta-lactamase class C family)
VAVLSVFILTRSQTGAANDDLQTDSLGRAFVAGVNSTSPEERRNIVKRIYAQTTVTELGEDRLTGLFRQMFDNYGKLTYHHTEIIGSSLHVFARAETNNQWHDFQFRLNSGNQLRLRQLAFIADVAEPVYLPNGGITSPFTLQWLNNYIDKLVQENDLAASVLIAKGDSIIFERYVGYADAARKRRIGPSTRMNLGSGNKIFTAISVMQLRDEGKLKLTDTLYQYFPDFPDKRFAASATIQNLLTHTSGLRDYWDNNYEKKWGHVTKLEQVLPFVYDDSIAFVPGTQFQYSNSGFIMAGLIVEKVSGEDYFDYVREHIFKPFGMSNTDSFDMDNGDTTLADGLSKSDSGWTNARHGRRGTSAGGGFSTPRDMLKFSRGLNEGNVLAPSTLKEMTEVRTGDLKSPFPYGYGLMLNLKDTRLRSFGHEGIAPGVNFAFQYYPAQDLTFVIFCNQDNGAYDDLRKNITKLITGDR